MPVIRVGTASPGTKSTKAATLRQLARLAHRAAAQSIDIFLLPEAYIGGYPRDAAFGCVVGDRTDKGREEFAKCFDDAADLGDTVGDGAGAGQRWLNRELPGQEDGSVRGDGTREDLENISRESNVFLVTGIVEKAGGSMYCSVVYVCPKAGIIGKRRKVMPTGTERLVWAQGCPSTLRAVSTIIRGSRVNLAAAICWENYMPVVRQALYSQNINLYLAPTADGRDAWLSLMRTIGIEGRCFVVSSNMAVRESSATMPMTSPTGSTRSRARRNSLLTDEGFEIALPSATSPRRRRRRSVFDEHGNVIVLGCDEENGEQAMTAAKIPEADTGWISRGGSSIVDPFGSVVAGPQWEDDDGLIYADIDLRDCIRGRLDIDTAGSYSRNDSFHFAVRGLDLDPLPY
ncbi:hypothetical protein E4U43_003086 [Claviceps pusilla]|uniref:CN hydrolase domain-containing protein n=1 Tax=Claviceps pusilla TaxID=123648 RepID=A0A9P7N5V6_9HYPO|nr:hypothetical protein E4U43_003086 [Claviceps pusilla]